MRKKTISMKKAIVVLLALLSVGTALATTSQGKALAATYHVNQTLPRRDIGGNCGQRNWGF